MANIFRFELEGIVGDLSRWMMTQHYQTDVSLLADEPTPVKVLDELLNHYSSSGQNMSKITPLMTTGAKLTAARVRQELHPTSTDVPLAADKVLNVAGTRTFSGDQLPFAACLWIGDRTGVPLRSARGGTHLPPATIPADLDSFGRWDSTSTYWTSALAYAAARLDALEDVIGPGPTPGGDLNPIVYSRTRRGRGDTPYVFAVTQCVPSQDVRWLRRRANRW